MSEPQTDQDGPAVTDPRDQAGESPVEDPVHPCTDSESDQPKSIHVDVGWVFTSDAPIGKYTLVLAAQTFTGDLNGGRIRIDKQLDSLCGSGSLEIRVTDGPVFRADVTLGLPAIQSAEGLKRRLTNLGYYAGTDAVFDGRARWAVRAFKRAVRNGFVRNATEDENNTVTRDMLTAVQSAYGAHPDDAVSGALTLTADSRDPSACGMFGGRALRRTSTMPFAAGDDRDAEGDGNNGTWENASAADQQDAIAGTMTLFLRAFDPAASDLVIPNRVNLPQHVRMLQFVLFELGFWIVKGTGGWTTESGTETRLVKESLWRHDDHNSANPRMYAIDWSGYYSLPGTHSGEVSANGASFPRPIVVGDWQRYMRWNGPRSVPPRHTWSAGELMPESLTGSAWASLSADAQSTFRVVRAVSEVECLGFFDSVNSYDNAFVSVGPCHWTLGIANADGSGAVDNGELCGYLAYLREADAAAFDDAVGFFGIRPDKDWSGNGAPLFSSGSRKYSAWMERQVLTGTTAGGLSAPWRTMPQAAPRGEPEGDYLKHWHWFYRYVMAGRVNSGYRRRMWHMARVRLRDIRAVPWGAGVAKVGAKAATIGDVFTSERATGMILRLHIRGPAWIVSGGNAGARLTGALTRAKAARADLTWTGNPSAWTNAHETALINGLTAELSANASASVQSTVTYVRNWANSWGNNPRGYALDLTTVGTELDAARGSFTLDQTGLPPAPP